MGDYRHARDIPDIDFLAAVEEAIRRRPNIPATRWDVERVLGGLESDPTFTVVGDVPGVPSKVVLAKARRLIRRGLLDGCECGCRGDFLVTARGVELLRPSAEIVI
ncbi:hypothetical protein ACFULT_26415 [Rhodococcus sp. NPDC057297]|uniref:hypothetical protein n=1 Tax=Rhodococcus sp. NPDC057297 TaxID=3346090 RepID=UPI0036291731